MNETPNNADPLQAARQTWDQAAASFDDAPDHGLRDPAVRAAWLALLTAWLPPSPAALLDIGCGTGSLSVALAGLGYQLSGIDLSPAMIALAREKAAAQGLPVEFQVMDAASPHFPRQQFDALLCRHVLWALPDPALALHRWSEVLKPQGQLLLVEGFWWTGAGLHASEITALLAPGFRLVSHQNLSAVPGLWGGAVSDERYALAAEKM